MSLTSIYDHSIRSDLIKPGITIDIGCRNWKFSKWMVQVHRQRVYAFDLEPLPDVPSGIKFMPRAVTAASGPGFYRDTESLEARHLADDGVPIQLIALNEVYWWLDYPEIQCLKIDAEGSEYAILSDPEFLPLPRQISVEFHEHCHPELHAQKFESCIQMLLRHYTDLYHFRTETPSGTNYWDSLFIRKDLL